MCLTLPSFLHLYFMCVYFFLLVSLPQLSHSEKFRKHRTRENVCSWFRKTKSCYRADENGDVNTHKCQTKGFPNPFYFIKKKFSRRLRWSERERERVKDCEEPQVHGTKFHLLCKHLMHHNHTIFFDGLSSMLHSCSIVQRLRFWDVLSRNSCWLISHHIKNSPSLKFENEIFHMKKKLIDILPFFSVSRQTAGTSVLFAWNSGFLLLHHRPPIYTLSVFQSRNEEIFRWEIEHLCIVMKICSIFLVFSLFFLYIIDLRERQQKVFMRRISKMFFGTVHFKFQPFKASAVERDYDKTCVTHSEVK